MPPDKMNAQKSKESLRKLKNQNTQEVVDFSSA